MKKISLVGSFREQHDLFVNMLISLLETTEEYDSIEVLPVVDDDDSETLSKIKDYEKTYACIGLKFLVTRRSRWFIKDYYNYGENRSTGRFLMNISADSKFLTKSWDKILYNKMSEAADKFGDDILYGMPHDFLPNSKDEGFSCWAVSSAQYVMLTGGMMPKEIPMWGADIELGKIFDLIDNGRRKIDLREIEIAHINAHCDESISKTSNAQRFEEMTAKYPAYLTHEQRMIYVDRIDAFFAGKIKICGIRH